MSFSITIFELWKPAGLGLLVLRRRLPLLLRLRPGEMDLDRERESDFERSRVGVRDLLRDIDLPRGVGER